MNHITRRDCLKFAGLGAAAMALPAWLRQAMGAADGKRKNVLFIFVDDLRPQLGCYGTKLIKSPNIDRLAAGGTLFERAYCQQAVCAPSRASVLSGLRPDSTGIYDLEHPLRTMNDKVVTVPQCFKEQGYETVSIGKIYHHSDDDKASFTRKPQAKGAQYMLPDTAAKLREREAEGRKQGLKGTALHRFARGPATECADVPDEAYSDGAAAREAVAQLRELKDKPFFMALGFIKPHLPFCAPKKYWDLYQRQDFVVPDRKKPEGMPPIALTDFGEMRSYTDIPKVGPVDDEGSRQLIHGYHAAVSYMDAQVGKVLDELDRLGLAENTIIALWGDHGWKLGEYGAWCKHSNVELDTHVPLIMRGPGIGAGKRCSSIVEMVDVYPTLVDLAGAAVPMHCEGASMRPLLTDSAGGWKNMAVSQYPRGQNGPVMGYSLRKDKWRYTEWVHNNGQTIARELYDHSESDLAKVNVVDRPENAALVAELSKSIRPFIKTRWDVFPPRRQAQPAKGKKKGE